MISRLHRALAVTATATALLSAPAAAGVLLTAQGVLKVFCADESGGTHPRRAEFEHVVDGRPGADAALLILQYQTDGSDKQGRVKGTVKLSDDDGVRAGTGAVSTPTDPTTGAAAATGVAPADLGDRTTANWNVRFRQLGRLGAYDCVLIVAAVGPTEGE